MKIFTWQQRIIVFSVTLLTVALFIAAGYGIGVWLGNTKAGIFIAVLVSYPFTQMLLIKKIRDFSEKERKEEN